MSNAKQILAMLQSKADGDDEHFYSIALQIAAAEARQGRRTLAEDLRVAVDKARGRSSTGQTVAVPFASPRGDLADLIEMRPARFSLDSVVMNTALCGRLDDAANNCCGPKLTLGCNIWPGRWKPAHRPIQSNQCGNRRSFALSLPYHGQKLRLLA
jgi:hypothetical protein